MTTIIAILSATASLITAILAAWAKLGPAIKPMLARRAQAIAIVCAPSQAREVKEFLGRLRRLRWRATRYTHSPASARDEDLVILWQPSAETVEGEYAELQTVAPEATVLIYTTQRLPLPPGSGLMSNSELRLYGDCLSVAEWLSATKK